MTLGRLLPAAIAASLCLSAPFPAMARGETEESAETGSTRSLYLLLIRQARTDGRPRAALAYLDDFERKYAEDREARILRVNCLLDLGQVAGARAALARIGAEDGDGQASAVRGHVLAAEGVWDQAAGEYAAALKANPASALTGNALGYALLRAGKPAQAVETLKGARDLAPRSDVIRNNLLLALTMAGRAGEAEATLGAIADTGGRETVRRQIAEQSARLWGAAAEARP